MAEKMLRDNGIYDVTVTSTSGMLTDHYNPVSYTHLRIHRNHPSIVAWSMCNEAFFSAPEAMRCV